MTATQPLGHLRVVDLSGLAGAYGSMLLGGLGAEVILVEPPGGHSMRALPPHAPGVDAPESGLWFAAFATGKKSVVLDVADEAERTSLRRLLGTADIVVTDALPGTDDAMGIGYDDVAGDNPGVVWVSITPFGRTGPKRNWQTSPLLAWAASGVLYTVGFVDRPPVMPGGEARLAYLTTSLSGALGALAGIRARRSRNGRGQVVDISITESCLFLDAENAPPLSLDDRVHRPRVGNRRSLAGPFGLYPCNDGYVSFLVLQPAHWEAMAAWLYEETGVDAVNDPAFVDTQVRYEAKEAIDLWTEELTQNYSKLELFQEGQRRGIPITPVNTIADLRNDPHLEANGFWRDYSHPELGTFSATREPFRTAPDFWVLGRAPLLGEHTEEVLGALASS